MTLTIELLKLKPQFVECVFFHEKVKENENLLYLRELCKAHHIPIIVGEKAFNILSIKENCYVIGMFKKFKSQIESGRHIVLVNPSDAGNLGTIIRTSVGFDLKDIVLIRPAVDIFDPKTVRASMGALFHINYQYYDCYEKYEQDFPKNNPYPFMLTASSSIQNVVFREPYSLIFGNEAAGLPDSFAMLKGGQPVVIPHSKSIDSLNLTIAAGIAMYSTTRKPVSGKSGESLKHPDNL